jgi:hypothetical protein|tara:strand:- start:343 stop:519 length:177 start_codon:yes stop_codon:yes gene_type:complete
MNEEDGAVRSFETAMGIVTVVVKDEPGPKGRKAGTSTMEYFDPPPRPIRLKKKYRHKG